MNCILKQCQWQKKTLTTQRSDFLQSVWSAWHSHQKENNALTDWPPCWPDPAGPMSYALATSRNGSLTPSHTWLRLWLERAQRLTLLFRVFPPLSLCCSPAITCVKAQQRLRRLRDPQDGAGLSLMAQVSLCTYTGGLHILPCLSVLASEFTLGYTTNGIQQKIWNLRQVYFVLFLKIVITALGLAALFWSEQAMYVAVIFKRVKTAPFCQGWKCVICRSGLIH